MRWRIWLRHCAISLNVTGSIPDGVIGTFHWHNPSGRTMALGLTRPLTEMSTRIFPRGLNTAGVQGWQPYHFYVPIVLKSGSLNLLKPSGPVQACNWISFLLTTYQMLWCLFRKLNLFNAAVRVSSLQTHSGFPEVPHNIQSYSYFPIWIYYRTFWRVSWTLTCQQFLCICALFSC